MLRLFGCLGMFDLLVLSTWLMIGVWVICARLMWGWWCTGLGVGCFCGFASCLRWFGFGVFDAVYILFGFCVPCWALRLVTDVGLLLVCGDGFAVFACGLRMFVLVIAVLLTGCCMLSLFWLGLLIHCCFLYFRLGVSLLYDLDYKL